MTLPGGLSDLGQHGLVVLYAILLAAAFLKYVFPPAPGDLASLLAIFWIGMKDGSFTLAVAALTLGGTLGAWVAFAWGGQVGAFLARRSPRMAILQGRVEAVLIRWGPWPLVVNRFVPYLRTFLFPSAGVLRMRRLPVLAAAFAGNLLFGLFLVGLAYTAGKRFARMNALYNLYLFWVGLAVLALLAGVGLWAYLASRRDR